MTATADAVRRLTEAITDMRRNFGMEAIDPFNASAPAGTLARRIKAHNALIDVAQIGQDYICGAPLSPDKDHPDRGLGRCVLKSDHDSPAFDDVNPRHMDVEQRDRAVRYLVHSDPNPETRA